nr:unnamed protein product [Digitaria exilis]
MPWQTGNWSTVSGSRRQGPVRPVRVRRKERRTRDCGSRVAAAVAASQPWLLAHPPGRRRRTIYEIPHFPTNSRATVAVASARSLALAHPSMAEHDLTARLAPHLDRHLVFPLLEFLQERGIYPEEEILAAKLRLLAGTNMVDYAVAIHRSLHGAGDDDGEFPAHMAAPRRGHVTAYLHHHRVLSTNSERSVGALWGMLASEILTRNWDAALEDLNHLKEIIDSMNFSSPLNQLQNRIWLMHWSLFIFFNHENGRNGITDLFIQDSILAEKLNMKYDETEFWIMNLVKTSKLDAKIDSVSGTLIMTVNRVDV